MQISCLSTQSSWLNASYISSLESTWYNKQKPCKYRALILDNDSVAVSSTYFSTFYKHYASQDSVWFINSCSHIDLSSFDNDMAFIPLVVHRCFGVHKITLVQTLAIMIQMSICVLT